MGVRSTRRTGALVYQLYGLSDEEIRVVNFSEAAREIEPIGLLKGGRVRSLQNLRYTTHKKLENAKTLDDLW